MVLDSLVLPFVDLRLGVSAIIAGAPKHKRRQRQRDRFVFKAFRAYIRQRNHHGVSLGKGLRGKGKTNNGNDRTVNFAQKALSWICKPCNWRNSGSASFCNQCGKAKQWVRNKNAPTQGKKAADLNKRTADPKAEFDKLKQYVKGKGKGKGNPFGGCGGSGKGGGRSGGPGGGGTGSDRNSAHTGNSSDIALNANDTKRSSVV